MQCNAQLQKYMMVCGVQEETMDKEEFPRQQGLHQAAVYMLRSEIMGTFQ
jgi:hypothetical protein